MHSISTLYDNARQALQEATSILEKVNSDSSRAYRTLVHHISTRDSDYLLYLGAGVTKSAAPQAYVPGTAAFNPPNWRGLLNGLFESWAQGREDRSAKLKEWARRADLPSEKRINQATDLLEGFDKLDLAKRIGDLFPTKEHRNAFIGALVQPDSRHKKMNSPLLSQIIRLPSSVIVTTNYDDIIERFIQENRKIRDPSLPRPSEGIASLSPEGPDDDEDYLHHALSSLHAIDDDASLTAAYGKLGVKLFYLHGSLAHRRNIVFDRYEYAALLQRGNRILDHVRHYIESMPAIYIGFGLDDPSFNLVEDSHATLDRQGPRSYAFVPAATRDEQISWQKRNLYLIQYGDDHAHLVTLLKNLSDVRKFLCWAEPARVSEVPPGGDRTVGYLDDALERYARDDFDGAIKMGRAALASTLFWAPTSNEDEDRKAHLQYVNIRTRLGLSHYKRRYLDSFPQALDRAEINADAAEKVLRELGELVV